MLDLLSQSLLRNPSETLWIADENSKALMQGGFAFSGDVLTNRWDIAKLAEKHAERCFFNDFNLADTERHYRRVVFPVSKEKASVHYVINEIPEYLGEGGELILLGGKQSGIKTYAAKAAQRLKSHKQVEKHGNDYRSVTVRNGISQERLDDQDYPTLRQPPTLGGLFSKPGQFGWDKVDRGSALLAGQVRGFLPESGANIVDLGCGYGFLCREIAQLGDFHFTATDNNAAALRACARNLQQLGLAGIATPSDAGAELAPAIADLLVCNPPFHQGFQVEGDLTERFLQNAARLLKREASALFVVNEFIPLPRKAASYFTTVNQLARQDGFAVYRLSV